ncbi:hypothetical protein DIPPA_01443 [Diplonema papillatum]|nr:hypothetical protein DIPPA_01443 [Diplonema papillatum]
MKKLAFAITGGTARERAVGVVSDGAAAMARLRVLPESERKERIQRMYDRHRRRELAKVVVSQWKWVARTRLQRVRDRTGRASGTAKYKHPLFLQYPRVKTRAAATSVTQPPESSLKEENLCTHCSKSWSLTDA